MNRKAIIFGIKGTKLSNEEKYLLKIEKPWGIILFSRNIKNLFQLKFLIDDIRKTIKDKNYPILIDQEGGRISRLNEIIDLSLFSQDSLIRFIRGNKFKIFQINYPYFDTPFFNKKNLLKIFNKKKISPPFYGSVITIFCKKI